MSCQPLLLLIIVLHAMESIVKIIVLGDPGVGKTTIISKFVRGEEGKRKDTRISQYDPDVSIKEIDIDGKLVKAYIHDSPRRESAFTSHSTPTPNFYRNVDAVILVYSVNNQQSLEALQDCWVTEFATFGDITDTSWIIVGNKNDLSLEIDQGTVKDISQRLPNSVAFFASAHTGKNVQELFELAIRKGYEVRKRKEGTINLKDPKRPMSTMDGEKKGCC